MIVSRIRQGLEFLPGLYRAARSKRKKRASNKFLKQKERKRRYGTAGVAFETQIVASPKSRDSVTKKGAVLVSA